MSLCMSVVARTFYSDGVLEWHLSQSRFLFKSRIPQGHPLRRKRQARVGRLNGSNQIRTVNSIGRTAWGGQRTAKRQKCARTARTPGVGAHAGLRDRLCLESRATFARNEQTRLGGGTRSALSRQGLRGAGAWLSTHGVKSSSLHEGRRCRSMRECVGGFRTSTCPGPLASSVCECRQGYSCVALDTRREELITPRGQALQEHA